jgi:hypothetical protein
MFDIRFPKHPDDYTVFESRTLKNSQSQIDKGVKYPEEKMIYRLN